MKIQISTSAGKKASVAAFLKAYPVLLQDIKSAMGADSQPIHEFDGRAILLCKKSPPMPVGDMSSELARLAAAQGFTAKNVSAGKTFKVEISYAGLSFSVTGAVENGTVAAGTAAINIGDE